MESDGSDMDDVSASGELEGNDEQDVNEDFGDDFDEFEAGAEDEDFGDFDEGTQQSSIPSTTILQPEPEAPPIQSLPLADIPFVSDPFRALFYSRARPSLT